MKLIKYLSVLALTLGMFACNDDDIKQTSALSFKEKAVTVAEDTGYVQIPLTLTTAITENAIVFVQIDEKSLTGGRLGSFCTYPAYVVLEPGAVRGFISMKIVDNDYPNENCSFDLMITQVSGGAIAAAENQSCKITIVDDDSKQKVSVGFDTVHIETGEDVGILEVPVTLGGLLSDYLTFKVEATDGTAVSTGDNWDYKLQTPEVRIVEGESWGVVNVAINDGKALKEDRSFKLKITGVKGHTDDDTTVSVRPEYSTCDVTIKKVIRKVMFADSVIVVNEAMKNTVDFGVQLTAPVDRDVVVTVQAKNNSTAVENVNYEIVSKQLTIKRGETLATTSIVVIDDTVGNIDRYCDFEIVDVTGQVEVAEGASSRVIFENDDSSIGFDVTQEYTWKGRKVIVPIHLSGLRDKRVVIDLEAVVSGEVKELTHFMILGKKLEIAMGDSVANAEIQVMLPAEEGFNFGVRIARISVEGLFNKVYREGDCQQCNIQVEGYTYNKLDMKQIVVNAEASSDSPVGESSGGGVAASMIDDNPSTYWHSAWYEGDHFREDPTKPYEIVFELDREYLIGRMEMLRRPGNTDTQGAVIEVSKDKVTWKKIFDFSSFPKKVGNNDSSGELTPEVLYSGKYIRVVPKANVRDVASIAELYLWSADL